MFLEKHGRKTLVSAKHCKRSNIRSGQLSGEERWGSSHTSMHCSQNTPSKSLKNWSISQRREERESVPLKIQDSDARRHCLLQRGNTCTNIKPFCR